MIGSAAGEARRRLRLLVLAGGCAAFAALAWPGSAPGAVTCSVAGSKLKIAVTKSDPVAVVTRLGDAIVVSKGPLELPVGCSGGVPTVFNTDSVVIRGRDTDAAALGIYMKDGPFAPGILGEGDGSSEIEFRVRVSGLVQLFVFGSPADDRFSFGARSGGLAANLNAGEPVPDVDLVAGPTTLPLVAGFGGADTLTAAGGPEFSRSWKVAVLAGHGGSDVLAGGRGGDYLDGGSGRDRLDGRAGADRIDAGRDGHDRVNCGPDRDRRAFVDRGDQVSGCESVKIVSRHDRRGAGWLPGARLGRWLRGRSPSSPTTATTTSSRASAAR